jgi:hypothetical protein
MGFLREIMRECLVIWRIPDRKFIVMRLDPEVIAMIKGGAAGIQPRRRFLLPHLLPHRHLQTHRKCN